MRLKRARHSHAMEDSLPRGLHHSFLPNWATLSKAFNGCMIGGCSRFRRHTVVSIGFAKAGGASRAHRWGLSGMGRLRFGRRITSTADARVAASMAGPAHRLALRTICGEASAGDAFHRMPRPKTQTAASVARRDRCGEWRDWS